MSRHYRQVSNKASLCSTPVPYQHLNTPLDILPLVGAGAGLHHGALDLLIFGSMQTYNSQHCGVHDGNMFHPDCFGAGFARRRQLPTHAHHQPMPDTNATPVFQIELERFARPKVRSWMDKDFWAGRCRGVQRHVLCIGVRVEQMVYSENATTTTYGERRQRAYRSAWQSKAPAPWAIRIWFFSPEPAAYNFPQ